MDTGFKRYMQLDDGEHKSRTCEVLKLSVIDNFLSCHANGMDMVNYLFEGEKLEQKKQIIAKWHGKVGFQPQRIKCQKQIVKTLYDANGYYLD